MVKSLYGAPVAMPLRWRELDDPGLHPRGWTLRTVAQRLTGGDPWEGFSSAAASPRSAARKLAAA